MFSPLSNQQAAGLHRQKQNQIQRLNEEQQGITNEYANFETGKQRSDLLFLYQKIEELIEATYLLIGPNKNPVLNTQQ